MAISPPPQKELVSAPGFPIVGNMIDFARDPIKFISTLQREYGDVVAFSLLGNKSILVSDPTEIERILLETGKDFGKFAPSYALRTVLGNGLVTSEGDFWRRQRKLIAPAFHHQSIKKYADQMVSYGQDLVETWHDGLQRDIHQDMMMLTQRIIMKVLFDVDVVDNANEASKSFDAMMQGLGAEMSGLDALLPSFITTSSRKHMIDGVNYINGLLLEIIEKRRTEGSEQADLLTMLMDARDDNNQPMTTEQLLDEIRSLYLAGHETTATTLSWTWLLLSQNPEAYAKLEAEIKQVLDGRVPTVEDVPNLVYCNAVIKESLRCYPVAWVTQRTAVADVEIGGFHVPKGTFIFLSPWIVHHDARWYDQAEAFMPERWLKDKAEQPARKNYIPFGGGPHICIGNGLAMMESVLLLATILQKYHVAVAPDQQIGFELAGTLRPKYGVHVTLKERSL